MRHAITDLLRIEYGGGEKKPEELDLRDLLPLVLGLVLKR